jgi:cytochrome c-type biogenesis protein CcmH/NrfG
VKKEYAFLSIAIAFVAGIVVGVIAAVYYEDKAPLIPPAVKQPTSSAAPAALPADLQKQIDTLRSILRDDPKNLKVLIQLGNLYFDTGQFDQAIENYSKALEIYPKNADVRTDLGIMYRKKGCPPSHSLA